MIYPLGAINLYKKHKNGFWSCDDGDDDKNNNGVLGKSGDWKVPVELN